jgi:hypothetical protein
MEGSEAEIYRGPGRGDVRYRGGDIFGFTVPCGWLLRPQFFLCAREGERRGEERDGKRVGLLAAGAGRVPAPFLSWTATARLG